MSKELHDKILSLPCPATQSQFATRHELNCFKDGHQAAREASAALALAAAAPQVVADERAAFDIWWAGFADTHEEWPYADSGALRWAAYQAGRAAAPVQTFNPVEFDGIKTAPVQAQEPVGYVNGDDLDNMLDDRTASIQSNASGWRRVALYRAPVQPVAVPDGWKLDLRATHYTLFQGNTVVANLAGPDAKENAAVIARMLAVPAAQGDAKDAERYRYIRDTETIEAMVWEALDGDGSVNGEGELDRAGYAAGMDRAIDAAIAAKAAS